MAIPAGFEPATHEVEIRYSTFCYRVVRDDRLSDRARIAFVFVDGFAIARFDALGTSCASSVASSHDSVVASEVADPVPIDLTGELNRRVLHIDDLVQPGPEQIARSRRRPGIATRFVIGLLLLKHICGLSDEGVCERWVHDPYFQYFTGEEFFSTSFPTNART